MCSVRSVTHVSGRSVDHHFFHGYFYGSQILRNWPTASLTRVTEKFSDFARTGCERVVSTLYLFGSCFKKTYRNCDRSTYRTVLDSSPFGLIFMGNAAPLHRLRTEGSQGCLTRDQESLARLSHS